MEQTLATIAAMCHQEETGYVTGDYLHQSQMPMANGPLHAPVDIDCRDKMVAWCFQVVDFCKFSRETVEIALSYLDRYMLTPEGVTARNDRTVFQLAAMTSLYTAVKIHEPEAMDPKLISTLSRGAYSPEEVERMEASLLGALKWRMNPPTSLAFVRQFLELVPAEVLTQAMREAVYDLSKYQSELAVSDYKFIAVRPSIIAYGSFMNSLESLSLDDKVLGYIGYILAKAISVECNDDRIVDVQSCLYQAVVAHPQAAGVSVAQEVAQQPKQKMASRRSSFEVSPRSISATR